MPDKKVFLITCSDTNIPQNNIGNIVFKSENLKEAIAYIDNLANEINAKKNSYYSSCCKMPIEGGLLKLRCFDHQDYIAANYTIFSTVCDINDIEIVSLPRLELPAVKTPKKPTSKTDKTVRLKPKIKIGDLVSVASCYFSLNGEDKISYFTELVKYIYDLSIAKYKRIKSFCDTENGEITEGCFEVCSKLGLSYVVNSGLWLDGFVEDKHKIYFPDSLEGFAKNNIQTIENILKAALANYV